MFIGRVTEMSIEASRASRSLCAIVCDRFISAARCQRDSIALRALIARYRADYRCGAVNIGQLETLASFKKHALVLPDALVIVDNFTTMNPMAILNIAFKRQCYKLRKGFKYSVK